jgi:hypothetical protein
MGAHIDELHNSHPERAIRLEGELNSLIENHYNINEKFRGLVQHAHTNSDFAATLHGVKVRSLTGEVGKSVKSVGTDIAALYGANAILEKTQNAMGEDPQTKKGMMTTMSKLQAASDALNKAASILESIPVKESAYKMATKLLDAGIIVESEVEKHASMFERNFDDAETILGGMLRGNELENKTANLGEPVSGDSDPTRAGSRSSFEDLCRQGNSGR